jgi:hypothetical protein
MGKVRALIIMMVVIMLGSLFVEVTSAAPNAAPHWSWQN